MPFSHAKVALIRGEQGSGKTNTLTGIIVDKYFKHLCGIQAPDGKVFMAKCHSSLLDGLDYHEYVDLLVPHPDGGTVLQTIKLPEDFVPLSTLRIFVNYHLFGLQYVYCRVGDIVEWINSGLIRNGILGIDEAYLSNDARRSMDNLSIVLTQYSQQLRKRQLETYVLVQHGRLIDWRWKWVAHEELSCKYNEQTYKIEVTQKFLKKGRQKTFKYYAPQYWKYYDTNELPEMPQMYIDKVIRSLRGGKH